MDKQYRYGLSDQERYKLQQRYTTVALPLLLPMDHLQEEDDDRLVLNAFETLILIWSIKDAMTGDIVSALAGFERKLLPSSSTRSRIWHASTLLWCALLHLYACDPYAALRYIDLAKDEDLSDKVPEFALAKGMALRLKGEPDAAIPIFSMLANRGSGLSTYGRFLALSWQIEATLVERKSAITDEQLRWLERKNRNVYNNAVDIVWATLYRMSVSSGRPTPEGRSSEDLLAILDQIEIANRPMLTMLLQDILPRPLVGVQVTESSGENQLE